MKVKELYNAVALLGFETDIDEEETFYPALHTALHAVLRLVPRVRRGILSHYPPTTLVTDTDKVLYSGGVLSYNAEGAKAFYLEISGKGKVIFTNIYGVTDETTPWDNPHGYRVIRCFLDNTKTIDIKAETMCKVRCVALYGELSSTLREDIPAPAKYVTYDMKRIFDNFGSIYEQPKKVEGDTKKTLSDYVAQEKYLSLPRDINGDIEIVYTPDIPLYTANDMDKEIDISDDCIGALKLLIASYVWIDDNKERSKYYKSLYDEEIAMVTHKKRNINITPCESVNNW